MLLSSCPTRKNNRVAGLRRLSAKTEEAGPCEVWMGAQRCERSRCARTFGYHYCCRGLIETNTKSACVVQSQTLLFGCSFRRNIVGVDADGFWAFVCRTDVSHVAPLGRKLSPFSENGARKVSYDASISVSIQESNLVAPSSRHRNNRNKTM